MVSLKRVFLDDVASRICKIPPTRTATGDQLEWMGAGLSLFSVEGANEQIACQGQEEELVRYGWLWKLITSKRLRVWLWRDRTVYVQKLSCIREDLQPT